LKIGELIEKLLEISIRNSETLHSRLLGLFFRYHTYYYLRSRPTVAIPYLLMDLIEIICRSFPWYLGYRIGLLANKYLENLTSLDTSLKEKPELVTFDIELDLFESSCQRNGGMLTSPVVSRFTVEYTKYYSQGFVSNNGLNNL